MVPANTSQGKEHKARGRPFAKGNVKGAPRGAVLGSSRLQSDSNGSNVIQEEKHKEEPLNSLPIQKEEKLMQEETQAPSAPQEESKLVTCYEGIPKPDTEVDSIEFTNGENKLKIVLLTKGSSRLMQVKVFLNDTIEIKPATYTSKSIVGIYFDMLRQHMKKH